MASGGDDKKKSRFSLSGFGGSSKARTDASAASSSAAEAERAALQEQLDQQTLKAAGLKETLQNMHRENEQLREELSSLKSHAQSAAPLDLLSDTPSAPVKNERVVALEAAVDSYKEQLQNVREVLTEKESVEQKLNEEKAALAADNEALKKRAAAADAEAKKLRSDAAKYKADADKHRSDADKLRSELDAAKKETDKLKSQPPPPPAAAAQSAATAGVDLLSLSSLDASSSVAPSSSSAPASSVSSERVSELETEVASLTKMNELMMDKVKKKDDAVGALRDQTEKLNQKIAQLEAESKQIKDKNNEIASLTKQLKDKDSQIAKARSGTDESSKSKVLTAELTKSNDRISALERERESIKAEKNGLQEQLNEKDRIIESKQTLIADLTTTTSLQEKKVTDLCDKLEKASAEFKKSLDEIERKYEVDVEALKNKDVSERTMWIEQRANFEQSLHDLTERGRVKDETIAEMEGKLELSLQECTIAKNERAALQNDVGELQTKIADLIAQQKVEMKKRKVLLRDLQVGLEKSLMSGKSKDIRIIELEDENKSLTRRTQQLALNTDGAENTTHNNGGGSVSPHHGGSPPHSPDIAPLSPQRAHSTPHVSSAVDEEVSAALATKLAAVQDENFTLKRKMRGLEEHVELLEHDVNQKKEMIRNFVRRIETGALTTSEQANDRGSQSAMYASLSHSDRQALFDKMETVLQETTMTNIQLKEQVKLMGEEVRKASDTVSAVEADKRRLEEELESIKAALEELREEKELAEQANADATKMVASTHTQLREKELLISELRAMLSDTANDHTVAGKKIAEQIEALKEERAVAVEESHHLKAELESREKELLVVSNTAATISAKLKQLTADNDALTGNVATSKAALDAAKAEFADAERKSSAAAAVVAADIERTYAARIKALEDDKAAAVTAARNEESAKTAAAVNTVKAEYDAAIAKAKSDAAELIAKVQSDTAAAVAQARVDADETIANAKSNADADAATNNHNANARDSAVTE